MKKIVYLLLGIGLLLAVGDVPVNAQTLLTNTTLSSAVTSASSSTIVVASATGITANTTGLYVDGEFLTVSAVNSTTISVRRGQNGTRSSTHASGATVFVGPLSTGGVAGGFQTYTITGSCTRGSGAASTLPWINTSTGVISDCLGGVWVAGRAQTYYPQPNGLRLPDPGATALTALETNGTAAGASTEMYCTELDIPQSMKVTGLKILNGTTVGTNNHNVELYDSSGNLLANSTAAGAVTASASTYQAYAFTTPYFAVGPARYFGCFTANGTTDTVRHAITAVNDNILAGKITGLTFGTISSTITPPSTFTTALGGYLMVY